MRTFMSALQRAHSGAWASSRDLGFCSGVTYAPLGIQALKPFLVCSELRPDQRHRHPDRPQSLVGRSISPRAAECGLLPALAWSGEAVHEYSPNPWTGPREDATGLERRQGFLTAPRSHTALRS
jgi:hypothetical protein